jgi:hypothetical protein
MCRSRCRSTVVFAVVGLCATASPAHAFDFQRFAVLRNPPTRAAAAARDPVGLRALQSFEGPNLDGGVGPMARAGMDLALLYHEHADYVARGRPGVFVPTVVGVRLDAERVLVEAVAGDDGAALLATLQGLGLADGAAAGRLASGWLPITALDTASRAPGLRQLRPFYAVTYAGLATSQGDTALLAGAARQSYGVDGHGVTVGVISDSFDCRNGYSTDVGTGDLPVGVTVLEEPTGCGGTDEGRAMAQIVHDLAPGAGLAFQTAFNGVASFANGIGRLVSQAGATVIVDDVGILQEPMFQDGPIAQAVDAAVGQGAVYFSAAGNAARQSYESAFRPTNVQGALPGWRRHDFDSGPSVDTLQSFTVSPNGTVYISLQWDQPFASVTGGAGATSDLSLVVYDNGSPSPTPLWGTGTSNVGGDPVDVLVFQNGPSAATYQLAIERVNNVSPTRVKYVYIVVGGTMTLGEYATNSNAIFGHANAAGARAVGAADYRATPAFGVQPPVLEAYSSRGGATILFDANGSPVNILRRKPEFVATDGVDTTFFGSDTTDEGSYPNFFGTSAAAPHAAGVAALARSADPAATPAAVYTALLDSAIDMGVAGYDADSGAGLVQADRALANIVANKGSGALLGFSATPSGTVLDGAFASDLFLGFGLTITDSDSDPTTSQTALPNNGMNGTFNGRYLYVPQTGSATWLDLHFTPQGRAIRFDFATPSGQIVLTGYDAGGAVALTASATGTTPFGGADGSTWLSGSVQLADTLVLSRLRIAPATGAGPLGIDNVSFTTAVAPTQADVPIPLAAVFGAAALISAAGYRRLGARSA